MSDETAIECLNWIFNAITNTDESARYRDPHDERRTAIQKLAIVKGVVERQQKQLDHFTTACELCGGQGTKDANRDGVDEPHECHECEGTGRVPKASTVDELSKEFLALVRLREEVHAWVLTYRETKKRDITGPDFDIAWGELSKLVMETLP